MGMQPLHDFNDYQINMALMQVNTATTEKAAVKAAVSVYHPTLDMADAVKGALENKIRQFRVPPGWSSPMPPPLPFGFDVMNVLMQEYYQQASAGVAAAAPAPAPAVPAPAAAPAKRRPQRRRPTLIRRGPPPAAPAAPPPQPQPQPGNTGSFSYPQTAWQQPMQSPWQQPPPQTQWRQPQRSSWQQPQQSQWRQPQSQWPSRSSRPSRPQSQWSQPRQPPQTTWRQQPRRPEPTPQYSPQGTTGQSEFINGWEQNYFGAANNQRSVPPPSPSPSSVPDFTPLASSMPGWINPFYNQNSNPSAWK